MRSELQKNYTIIKELENANNEYKTKINDLTDKNNSLTRTIEELEKKIDLLNKELESQKNENISLSQKIKRLEKRLDDYDDKEMIRKFSIAIQDYNSRYSIEKIARQDVKNSLVRLRENRNGDCHYCEQLVSDEETNGKFYVLSDRIHNMMPYLRDKFNKKYPKLLCEMEDLLRQDQFTKPSEDILYRANDLGTTYIL